MNTLLRAESVDAVQSWNAPQVDGASSGRKPRTVRELQAAEEAVWQRVREEARLEGLAAARQEIDARVARLDAQARQLEGLLDLLAKPLARLDHDMEIQLTELSVAIARQLLRRELKAEPSQVIAVVRETVGLLPASARDVRVSVHPEDAALLRERLAIPQTPGGWTLIEDPMLARGDCRVATDTAQIDARTEARLNAAIAHLLGDERAQERQREREPATREPNDGGAAR